MVEFSANSVRCSGIRRRRWHRMASISTAFLSSVLLLILAHIGPVLASENDVDDTNRRVVLVGTNLQLPCTPPDAEDILDYFTWSKNGVLLPDRSSTALQSRFIIQSDFSLLIERVAEDDEGNYSCSVQSLPPRTTNYSVQVEVPAAIDELLHHVAGSPHHQLREGGDLDLVCLAKGKPLPTVIWKYQGRVLSAEVSIVDVNQKVSSVHRIENARRLDAGSYICEADNGVDLPAVATFNVEVSYAPEIVVEQSWVHTGLGALTELACTVYAQPLAQVTWFRSGESIGGSENDKQQHQVIPSNRIGTLVMANGLKHVLRFKSVRDADLGVYTCQAENPHGRAEAAVEMSGKAMAAVLWVSPPRDADKPVDLEQQGVDGSKVRRIGYRLTWDAVSRSPIYEYRLWLRPRGQPEISWINLIIPSNSSTGSSPSLHSHGYELSDLATGVVYQVSVQSRNRFGWSAESNTVYLSGGEDPELDYDNEDNVSSTVTTTTTTTTTTTAAPIDSSSVASSSVTIQVSIEVTESVATVDDNHPTQPALVIDPVSVHHHGTHQEVQTTTMEPPTQETSQSIDNSEICPSGDCEEEPVGSKDPENLPSSIVAPGNDASSWSCAINYLSVTLCTVALLAISSLV